MGTEIIWKKIFIITILFIRHDKWACETRVEGGKRSPDLLLTKQMSYPLHQPAHLLCWQRFWGLIPAIDTSFISSFIKLYFLMVFQVRAGFYSQVNSQNRNEIKPVIPYFGRRFRIRHRFFFSSRQNFCSIANFMAARSENQFLCVLWKN